MPGAPQHAARTEINARRVQMLDAVSNAINSYSTRSRTLPASLNSRISFCRWNRAVLRVPVTSEPFGYSVLDSTHYQLCATFDTADTTGDMAIGLRGSAFWAHGAGRHCFRLQVPAGLVNR